jgi:hypothetical protein
MYIGLSPAMLIPWLMQVVFDAPEHCPCGTVEMLGDYVGSLIITTFIHGVNR